MRLRLAAVSLAAGIFGCTAVNPPSAHQKPVPSDQFCSQFADVVCQDYDTCCSKMPKSDPSVCVDDVTSFCTTNFGGILLDTQTGYDPLVAAAVLSEGRGFANTCSTNIANWALARSGFLRVLTGTVPGGQPCATNVTTFPSLPAFFSCEDTNQACVNQGGGTWTCNDLRTQGQPCYGDQDCLGDVDPAKGLWCQGSALFRMGTCQPRLADGVPCPEGPACQSLVCEVSQGDGGVAGDGGTSPDGGTRTCVTLSQDAAYCALSLLGAS